MAQRQYSDNALTIYKRLYLDEKQHEQTPMDVHHRVANAIATTDDEKADFIRLLEYGIFRPNSPCIINAGRLSEKAHDKQLCACFVLGLEDSMESIIEMWSVCAKIYASGAGAGIPLTNLRENNSPITSGGVASGPRKYVNVVDVLSDTVRSGGRSRRAANIGVFRFDHPETLEIIDAKCSKNGKLKSFNLSMSITDQFMHDINDPDSTVEFISPNKNDLSDKGSIKSFVLWNKVAEAAWTCGDPGLLFIDQVNKFNPFPSMGQIDCTNPCGEVPLIPWSVCNIGSMNLKTFIIQGRFDWEVFKKQIHYCVTFLDNVIDKTAYIHEKFKDTCMKTRPIGLGIMGFADVLIRLGIEYGSRKSIELFEDICKTLTEESIKQSIILAKEKGAIDIPDEDREHFIELLKHYTNNNEQIIKDFEYFGIRNSTWTCIAPTGSISISCDASYAWEPLMALVWEKPLVDSDKVLKIIDPQFEKALEEHLRTTMHDSYTNTNELDRKKQEIYKRIVKNHGSIQELTDLPKKMRRIFKVAHDIDPLTKITMQGAGQNYISLAISSTCNLPNSATVEEIKDIYEHAHNCGLKGITIFRDGCLDTQIVNFGEIEKEEDNLPITTRPIKRIGETIEINTPQGKLFVTCNFNEKKPFEIFYRIGKQGALTNVLVDALGRVCSKALQYNIPIEVLSDTLRGLQGEKFWFKIADDANNTNSAESIIDAISQLIDHYWINNEMTTVPLLNIQQDGMRFANGDECPNCHRKTLRHDTGCRGGSCVACGYSNCG